MPRSGRKKVSSERCWICFHDLDGERDLGMSLSVNGALISTVMRGEMAAYSKGDDTC